MSQTLHNTRLAEFAATKDVGVVDWVEFTDELLRLKTKYVIAPCSNVADPDVDLTVTDFEDLATKLGC